MRRCWKLFFVKLKEIRHIILTIKSVSSITALQIIWPYSKSYKFYAVVDSADKDPHSIDKLSYLAEFALPVYSIKLLSLHV